jgi:hypothetical protein
MLGPELELNISIPEQTRVALSFADATPAGIEKWVAELPMTNVGETSRQLYMAIRELNELALVSTARSKLLEILRPTIHYVCDALSKHFLGQPVVLPEKQQKIANLSQALQVHLATGYKIVLMDLVPELSNEKNRKAFAFAAHRMIAEYGNVLLRSYQLYSAPPKSVWLELHQTFLFCEQLGLMKYSINDETNSLSEDTRIDQAYKRCLLLSCCRPNQLRQDEIRLSYDAFEIWSDYVEVGGQSAANAVFVVNMQQDLPPRYRSLMQQTLADYYYGFDTAELVSRITSVLTGRKGSQVGDSSLLPCPRGMTDTLLTHLDQALGILTKRTFKRISSNGELELCAGLSACHYYISGEVEFHQQMLDTGRRPRKTDENLFISQSRKKNDAWSDAFDASASKEAFSTHADIPITFNRPLMSDPKKAYLCFRVPLINTSPGGYCLQWQGEMPANVQAGELIGIREQKKGQWRIAVIRWIRSAKQKGTQLGIELLAPNAQPCGVQLHHKTGAPSEFMRGLLLPELGSIGQSATIITPRVPFQSGSRVAVREGDTENRSNLGRRVTATGSFSQFEIKLSLPEEAPAPSGKPTPKKSDPEDDFDSLWPTL